MRHLRKLTYGDFFYLCKPVTNTCNPFRNTGRYGYLHQPNKQYKHASHPFRSLSPLWNAHTAGGSSLTMGGQMLTMGGSSLTTGGALLTMGGGSLMPGGASLTMGGEMPARHFSARKTKTSARRQPGSAPKNDFSARHKLTGCNAGKHLTFESNPMLSCFSRPEELVQPGIPCSKEYNETNENQKICQ